MQPASLLPWRDLGQTAIMRVLENKSNCIIHSLRSSSRSHTLIELSCRETGEELILRIDTGSDLEMADFSTIVCCWVVLLVMNCVPLRYLWKTVLIWLNILWRSKVLHFYLPSYECGPLYTFLLNMSFALAILHHRPLNLHVLQPTEPQMLNHSQSSMSLLGWLILDQWLHTSSR